MVRGAFSWACCRVDLLEEGCWKGFPWVAVIFIGCSLVLPVGLEEVVDAFGAGLSNSSSGLEKFRTIKLSQ